MEKYFKQLLEANTVREVTDLLEDFQEEVNIKWIPVGGRQDNINAFGAVNVSPPIGSNVWIAAKASIVKGVTIGDNAIIGANAVVCRDVPANAIAVGVPARVVRMRTGLS